MNYVGDTTKEPTLEHIYQTEMVQIKYDATYMSILTIVGTGGRCS